MGAARRANVFLLAACAAAFACPSAEEAQLRRAAELYRRGNLTEAQSLLNDVIGRHGGGWEAHSLMGVILDARKKHDEALRFHLEAAKRAPNRSLVWNNLGNHHLLAGNPAKAEEAFRRVLSLEPGHANALVQLARIAVLGKRGPQALAYLDKLGEAARQRDPAVGFLRAEALHAAGRREEASHAVGEIETRAGGDARVSFTAGLLWFGWQQYTRAEESFSRALQAEPANPDILYNLGVAALRAGRLERARSALEAVRKLRPEDAGAMEQLAQVHRRQGQAEVAVLLLLEASKKAADRDDILLALAQACGEAGFAADAAVAYDRYLKRKPDDAVARRERGYALARAGRFAEARADLEWYAGRHPEDPAGHFELAMALAPSDRNEAFRRLEEALRLRPDFVPARQVRGALHYLEGRAEQALPDLQFAAAADPHNVRALEQLGQAYLALGRPAEAAAVLRRALELSPESRRALIHLGRALRELGRDEEADLHLRNLERLGPDYRAAAHGGGLFDFFSLTPAQQREHYERHLHAAMAARPGDPELRLRLASLLLAEGNQAQALEEFRAALELSPEPRLLATGARALLEAGHYAAATPYLKRLAELEPDARHRLDLARALLHSSGPAAALKELENIPPDLRQGDYFLVKAQVLEALGRSAEAEQSILALDNTATQPELYRKAAAFLVRHESFAEARALLEKAARAFPDDREILLARVVVEELLGRGLEAGTLEGILRRWPEWGRGRLVRAVLLQCRGRIAEAGVEFRTASALGEKFPETLASQLATDSRAALRNLFLSFDSADPAAKRPDSP